MHLAFVDLVSSRSCYFARFLKHRQGNVDGVVPMLKSHYLDEYVVRHNFETGDHYFDSNLTWAKKDYKRKF